MKMIFSGLSITNLIEVIKDNSCNHQSHCPMREKVGIIYALYGSIQRTHYVYIQWLLQDRHTLCSTQRMAWRGRSRRRQREVSLEYLTEEKIYPSGTTDKYFEAPYEEYPITICGQTVILTNGEPAGKNDIKNHSSQVIPLQ